MQAEVMEKREAKRIFVTPRQVAAAQELMLLDDTLGRVHDPAITLIANAQQAAPDFTESGLESLPDGTILRLSDGSVTDAAGWDDYDWDDDGTEHVTHERYWRFFGTDITFKSDEVAARGVASVIHQP